jgi:hypothetical protein
VPRIIRAYLTGRLTLEVDGRSIDQGELVGQQGRAAFALLMRTHAAEGNTAEALRVYERCRKVIADELGVDPSPDTKALHASVLRSV